MHLRTHLPSDPTPRAGFTLVEVVVCGAIIAISLLGLLSSMISASNLQRSNRETTLALNAISAQIESLHTIPMKDLLLSHGSGSFGETFSVPGLEVTEGYHYDPGSVSAVTPFYWTEVGRVQLHFDETFTDAELGLPRDLNADGDASDVDITTGRMVLVPARVTVRWEGVNGMRELTAVTLLARR